MISDRVWEYTLENLNKLNQNYHGFLLAAKAIFDDLNAKGVFNNVNPKSNAAALTYLICSCLDKKITQYDVYVLTNITMNTIGVISRKFHPIIREDMDLYWELMEHVVETRNT